MARASSYRASRQFDSSIFLGTKQEDRFRAYAKWRFLTEKHFEINDQGDYRMIAMQLQLRKWGVLINPPKKLNYDGIREFYTNTIQPEGETFEFNTMVRERTIHFNKDDINAYLGESSDLQGDTLCVYA